MHKNVTYLICFGLLWSGVTGSFSPALAGNTPPAGKATIQAYFSVLPDIPLMPKMRELEDQAVVFDKAEGQLVEAVGFLSASKPDEVRRFYDSALLSLGWKALKNGAFQRNGEFLQMKTEVQSKGVLVRFQLAPVSR